MNKLKVFQNERFGEVRIEIVNGKEMFCANDVAKALGYNWEGINDSTKIYL